MKKFCISFIDVLNVKYIVSSTCSCNNLTKVKNQTVSTKKVTKKERPRNLNFAEPSKSKRPAFLVSLC